MKKFLLLLFLNSAFCIVHCTLCFAQNPGEWVWLHGDSITNNPGNFGTQGIPSQSNEPPSLYAACQWTDLSGNFWLFGGVQGSGVQYGDLWKYDPISNEWTWIKGSGIANDTGYYGIQGVASPANRPPDISWGAFSWTDLNNNLWMFGGIASGYRIHSDLWKYNISSNEWTWVKGPHAANQPAVYGTQGMPSPTNNPNGRQEVTTRWVDSTGNLWLFGGCGIGLTNLNDVWKYDILTNEWSWMKGSQYSNDQAIYGVLGIENSSNTPDGRYAWSGWKDNAGNFWLLGGLDSLSVRNDLWRFSPNTNNWTWMNGSSVAGTLGTDGTKCILGTLHFPSATTESRSVWTDPNGDFWIRCWGYTYFTSLWKYCVDSNEWMVVNGDSVYSNYGRWGVKGVSDPSNMPPGLLGAMSWSDSNGHLYMFGGEGGPWYNTLWMYTIDPCCGSCSQFSPVQSFSVSDSTICPGTCIDVNNFSQSYTSYHWIFFPGGSPSTSSDFNPQNICYNTPGSYGVTLIATRCNGTDTLTLNNYITVFPQPSSQAITQSYDTLFAIAGTGTYQWYFNNNIISGATDYFYVAPASGDYNVVATDTNGCEVEAAIFNVTAGLTPAFTEGDGINLYPNPVTDKLMLHYSQATNGTSPQGVLRTYEISIYNMVGEIVYSVVDTRRRSNGNKEVDCRLLPLGVYWLEVSSNDNIFRAKFIKQ
ncbi:MAG: T9SS type A sorting domain-containing protein [Bacteroidetes bacterium]|nr:T9SS type A sorting domain-containing protein [Bacteroidota bacterium]